MNVLSILKTLEEFREVPDKQLEWLMARGELLELSEGEHLFKPDDPIDKLIIILKGEMVLNIQQGNQYRIVSTFTERSISGLLPYSRADKAKGYGVATLPTSILRLDKIYFREMITDHEELTTALVHKMSSRIRQFTRFEQQNDKMMALGKLSAGLAHELNNPSAAVIRSAQTLGKHVRTFPDIFKGIVKTQLLDDQIEAINEILMNRLKDRKGESKHMNMLERSGREDELMDWLEKYDLDNPEEMSANLVAFSFTTNDLQRLATVISDEAYPSVISWIDQILTTERLVAEIEDASHRINKLVLSVKNYTHMDSAPEKEASDIHEGLENTLTMLNHKLKKANIQVIREYKPELEQPKILVNEMNQVWTNLIDNAIDAMEHAKNRVLTLRTSQDSEYVYVFIGDTGSGIPEEIQGKVFDPFFTTKPVGKGTGLGMEVVQQIVYQQHNGSVSFISKPGKTEFKVCIPIH